MVRRNGSESLQFVLNWSSVCVTKDFCRLLSCCKTVTQFEGIFMAKIILMPCGNAYPIFGRKQCFTRYPLYPRGGVRGNGAPFLIRHKDAGFLYGVSLEVTGRLFALHRAWLFIIGVCSSMSQQYPDALFQRLGRQICTSRALDCLGNSDILLKYLTSRSWGHFMSHYSVSRPRCWLSCLASNVYDHFHSSIFFAVLSRADMKLRTALIRKILEYLCPEHVQGYTFNASVRMAMYVHVIHARMISHCSDEELNHFRFATVDEWADHAYGHQGWYSHPLVVD